MSKRKQPGKSPPTHPSEEKDDTELNRRLANVYLLAIKRYQEHNCGNEKVDGVSAANTDTARTQSPSEQATG